MIVSKEEFGLWRLSLITGRRIIVVFPQDKFDVPLSKVEPLIIKEFNEKFGCELVRRASYYGKATEVQIADRMFKRSVLKKYGL